MQDRMHYCSFFFFLNKQKDNNALCFSNKQVFTHLKALTGGLVRVIRATDRLTSSYRAILLS